MTWSTIRGGNCDIMMIAGAVLKRFYSRGALCLTGPVLILGFRTRGVFTLCSSILKQSFLFCSNRVFELVYFITCLTCLFALLGARIFCRLVALRLRLSITSLLRALCFSFKLSVASL